jgi:hypothetical protein
MDTNELLITLKDMGVELICTCVSTPVQFEGELDGLHLYFKARGNCWRYAIAPTLEYLGSSLIRRISATSRHVSNTANNDCESSAKGGEVNLLSVAGLELLALAPEWLQLLAVGAVGGVAIGLLLVTAEKAVQRYLQVNKVDSIKQIMAVANLPEALLSSGLEYEPLLRKTKTRTKLRRDAGLISEADYLSISTQIEVIGDLIAKLVTQPAKIKSDTILDFNQITDLALKLLQNYNNILDEDSVNDIDLLFVRYQWLSLLGQAYLYSESIFTLEPQTSRSNLHIDGNNLSKTILLIAEIIENFWSAIPGKLKEIITGFIGTLLKIINDCLDNSTDSESNLKLKGLKRILNSTLFEISKSFNVVDDDELKRVLLEAESLSARSSLEYLIKKYPGIPLIVAFYSALLFEIGDLCVEQVAYKVLGDTVYTEVIVIDNISMEDELLVYDKELDVQRAFPEVLINFNLVKNAYLAYRNLEKKSYSYVNREN